MIELVHLIAFIKLHSFFLFSANRYGVIKINARAIAARGYTFIWCLGTIFLIFLSSKREPEKLAMLKIMDISDPFFSYFQIYCTYWHQWPYYLGSLQGLPWLITDQTFLKSNCMSYAIYTCDQEFDTYCTSRSNYGILFCLDFFFP